MSVSYNKSPSDIVLLANELLNELFPTLNEFGVKVGVISVRGDEEGQSLIVNGYEVCGTIKVMNTLDRLTKGYDCELLIDQLSWDEASQSERRAMLDYFLYQLELVPNSDKAIEEGELPYKLDSLGRPKLKLKKGDWNAGIGFSEVVKRNKDDSVEVKNLKVCTDKANIAKNGEVK